MTTTTLAWGTGMSGLTFSDAFAVDRDSVVEVRVEEDEAVVHIVDDEVSMVHHAGTHELRTDHGREWLIFVSTARMPVVEIGRLYDTRFPDAVHGPVELRIEGAARLRVGDAKGFYESFLRNTTHIEPERFDAILESLVHASIAQALRESFDTVDEIERDLGRLSAYLQRRLITMLGSVGITIDCLELTRLENPAPKPSLSAREGSPPLVTGRADQ